MSLIPLVDPIKNITRSLNGSGVEVGISLSRVFASPLPRIEELVSETALLILEKIPKEPAKPIEEREALIELQKTLYQMQDIIPLSESKRESSDSKREYSLFDKLAKKEASLTNIIFNRPFERAKFCYEGLKDIDFAKRIESPSFPKIFQTFLETNKETDPRLLYQLLLHLLCIEETLVHCGEIAADSIKESNALEKQLENHGKVEYFGFGTKISFKPNYFLQEEKDEETEALLLLLSDILDIKESTNPVCFNAFSLQSIESLLCSALGEKAKAALQSLICFAKHQVLLKEKRVYMERFIMFLQTLTTSNLHDLLAAQQFPIAMVPYYHGLMALYTEMKNRTYTDLLQERRQNPEKYEELFAFVKKFATHYRKEAAVGQKELFEFFHQKMWLAIQQRRSGPKSKKSRQDYRWTSSLAPDLEKFMEDRCLRFCLLRETEESLKAAISKTPAKEDKVEPAKEKPKAKKKEKKVRDTQVAPAAKSTPAKSTQAAASKEPVEEISEKVLEATAEKTVTEKTLAQAKSEAATKEAASAPTKPSKLEAKSTKVRANPIQSFVENLCNKKTITYAPRVTRWFQDPLSQADHQRIFPEYVQDEHFKKMCAAHSFSLSADQFREMGKEFVEKDERGRTTRTFLLPAKFNEEHGYITWTFDKNDVCFHRFFHVKPSAYESFNILQQKSLYQEEFPSLEESRYTSKNPAKPLVSEEGQDSIHISPLGTVEICNKQGSLKLFCSRGSDIFSKL